MSRAHRPSYRSIPLARAASLAALALGLCAAPAQAQGLAPTARRWVAPGSGGLVELRENDLGDPGAGSQALGLSSVVWTLESDGSWIAETVALGWFGSQVFVERGAFQLEALLLSTHDDDPPQAAWTDALSTIAYDRSVDSADRADVHVALHQEAASGSPGLRSAVLRKYTSSSSQPDWTYVSPQPLAPNVDTYAHVSADGGTIVLLTPDASPLSTHVAVFGPDSPVPTAEVTADTFGGVSSTLLSADGSTLALLGTLKLVVIDLPTLQITRSELLLGQPQYGALALSGDGSRVVTATLGSVRVLEKDDQGQYQAFFELDLGPASYGRRAALSEDGSTLVVGAHHPGNWDDAQLLSVDLDTQTVLFDIELAGGGAHQNLFSEIECSTDGRRFAVGLWGDEDEAAPELLVFRRDSPVPLLVHQTPGSVLDLDLDPSGDRVAVASKGVHANVWGGGGRIELIEIGAIDLRVAGVPHPGATVTVEALLRAGSLGEVLVSDALLDQPVEDPALGAGLLYLDPASMTALPAAVAEEDDVARTPFALDAGLLPGRTYYLQGRDLTHGRLSREWVAMTVLP